MKNKLLRFGLPLLLAGIAIASVFYLRHRPKIPQEPMPVLMYHHMVPDGEECNDMTVTPAKFRGDLDYILRQGYTPVLPRELAAGDPLPEKPILITFDDGYRSNYTLLYPILQEYQVKACISIIVLMPDLYADNFCSWNQLREMTESGLVEIGSHSYQLHNLGDLGGSYNHNGANGVQRRKGESDSDFQTRVLDDIQLSHDRIAEELDSVTCFAYPFGAAEPDARELVESLFPVTLMTNHETAESGGGAAGSAPLDRHHGDESCRHSLLNPKTGFAPIGVRSLFFSFFGSLCRRDAEYIPPRGSLSCGCAGMGFSGRVFQPSSAIFRPISTPMTEAIISPRVQPELESPRQCSPCRLVLKSVSIFTRLV